MCVCVFICVCIIANNEKTEAMNLNNNYKGYMESLDGGEIRGYDENIL